MTAAEPCRYAVDPAHVCVTNQGAPIHDGQVCWHEAAAQLRPARAERALAERRAQGLPDQITDPATIAQIGTILRGARRVAS